MAPIALARLVALQAHRKAEIEQIGSRMRERAPDTLNRVIVQTRVDTIREIWAEARKTHHDITLRAESEEHPYTVENEFQAMRCAYEDASDWLITTLANLPSEDNHNPRRRTREDDEIDDQLAKLPRLDLPSFSGNYEDWDSFADIFRTLVHNAPRLADTAKLQYLKSCLTGAAGELVKDVAIIGVNYISTWKALHDRFHNPRLTINKLLDSLFNMPYLKKESAVDLSAFVDEVQRIIRALTNLRTPVQHWDIWLVHAMEIRLDPESRKIWESELIYRERQTTTITIEGSDGNPWRFAKFVDLVAFLERRAQSLLAIHADKDEKKGPSTNSSNHNSRRVHHANASLPARTSRCALCAGEHFISRCPTYLAKKVHERQSDVRQLKLCFNCLGQHKFNKCRSTYTCKVCREKHHSTLHRPSNNPSSAAPKSTQNGTNASTESEVRANVARIGAHRGIAAHACNRSVPEDDCPVLLATALVKVASPDGREVGARALLDQGSEATFVSESLVQLLGLSRDRVHTNLTGVGGCAAGLVKSATRFTLRSRSDASFQKQVNAFILPRLTSDLPSRASTKQDLTQLEVLPLADPFFNTSGRIDLMIGADLYGQLLRPGLKQVSSSGLVAQNTAFGWIISGPTYKPSSRRAVHANCASIKVLRCVVNSDLSELLQRFWTLEEVPAVTDSLKPDDKACEKFFTETHKRGSDGRYQVRLPRVEEIPRVGMETQRMALFSLTYQHKRLARDPQLNRAYTEFMQTYYDLGHMERVPDHERNNPYAWYLPHHAVMQAAAIPPKIRVVFDASRQTRDKHSLNDFLMAGPPLQSELDLILLNWRRYRYGFTADIVKMFRQIRVAREDQDLQRIVWSPVAESPPIHYRLTTVTYGTSCAPYLAIRTLLQLARDEEKRFPLGAACLESETYVDDTFAGADDLASAIQKRDELIAILRSAGVKLDKWAATHPELLPSSTTQGNGCVSKEIDSEKAVKTLGVHWSPSLDCFSFTIGEIECRREKLTKRTISSDIARLFDPLGWLAPITMTAKTILQDLWLEKVDWDARVSGEVFDRWLTYCRSLGLLSSLSVPRWLGLSQRKSYEVHGFSDASKRAYAAVVYLRIDNGDGTFAVSLLAAKTKVAPVKTVSIPNLELLGAVLTVKLVRHLQGLEFVRSAPVRLWSDSRIVLMWLKKHPCHWKTFVANRVSLIQTELPSATWDHVPTKQNPADIASRGATPAELKSLDLWWQGPPWLASHSQAWPQSPETVQILHTKSRNDEPEMLSRYSTLTRLTRVTAWCLRPFLQYTRRKAQEGLYTPFLSTAELDNARQAILKLAQSHVFACEIELLRDGKGLPRRHALHSLRPFLDSDGVLRVGGRLSNAPLPSHVRNPPILPRQSALSRLFVAHAHCKALHGGPTLTTSVLLRFAWIIGMRALIKSAIRKCVKCQRHKPRLAHQLMGNLPAERVTPARPFTTTGLDYAGPFQVRTSKGRGQRAFKGYIALFVCFATKAIHLELVSDPTTPSDDMSLVSHR
ncbi:uncharacterized protein LOC131670431 [Phymastichus coffea]|uniref:uncharacterized protein LOC131670431 n=1 Tax=Phymastichus coffea TaxID=108790 RepID=UPI00273C8AC4|nr:uncharacterized protein LOC131670431 [Phymastichus coffea]